MTTAAKKNEKILFQGDFFRFTNSWVHYCGIVSYLINGAWNQAWYIFFAIENMWKC
jgi:hypothetical protein